MTIKGLGGEFALIERIAASQRARPLDSGVIVGIGDDTAVLQGSTVGSLLVTTDLLVEDVHFRRFYGDPFSLGVKAAAVNLSDIAAMAGTPTAAFISLALPEDTDVLYLDELYRGIHETFNNYGAVIAGGDTNVTTGNLVINVALTGYAGAGGAVLRSTASAGDHIIVTGELGAGAAGFALLEAVGRTDAEQFSPEAVSAQLRPVPRLGAARTAVAAGHVTAMMDLSDGLAGDLQKLCKASGVGAAVRVADVPISNAAFEVALRLKSDARSWALSGGEDYELLMTVRPDESGAICRAVESTGLRASVVGQIVAGNSVQFVDPGGHAVSHGHGWDHFSHSDG